MKILSSKVHGMLDYAFIIFVLLSPTIFKMEGTLCTLTYTLGVAHLLVTVLTNFELGMIKIIPFRIHGLIEIIVALALAALAYWFKSNANTLGFYYYMALAIVILVVFILTDFKSAPNQS